jgi:hypothetical protein
MFAVPPFPGTNDHFVPRLSKTKFHYKGFGVTENFFETTIEATGEKVNGVTKPSISSVKKALIDNCAIFKDDVMLREIGRHLWDYHYRNNEIRTITYRLFSHRERVCWHEPRIKKQSRYILWEPIVTRRQNTNVLALQ